MKENKKTERTKKRMTGGLDFEGKKMRGEQEVEARECMKKGGGVQEKRQKEGKTVTRKNAMPREDGRLEWVEGDTKTSE